jgi:Flp pilus assembly protein TadG
MQVTRAIHRGNFMSGLPAKPRFRREQGFVIILVAVFMLFVVGAMAALSIDVVTFYTARSEAQLAADAGALAGARVLANSGATSYSDGTMLTAAQTLAAPVATQVAMSNTVGGQTLPAGQIQVSFTNSSCPASEGEPNNPCVTVQVTAHLPVFFARIWGSTQVAIAATATAEAFNPSGLANGTTTSVPIPIAPSCVKPWLLPNLDPTSSSNAAIFDEYSGQIVNPNLLGASLSSTMRLHANCGSGACNAPAAWQYYVGDDTTVSFQPPTQALPSCTLNDYQKTIAGCVQAPIICGASPASQVNIQLIGDSTLDQQAGDAVNCLAHTSGGNGDTIASTSPPVPFEFLAGSDNPLVQAGTLPPSSATMVSDSLVTVPVFDSAPSAYTGGTTVTVIGFLQLFLEPSGEAVVSGNGYGIDSRIVNIVGCGINSNLSQTAVPVYGNGATAVPVRLISPP